MPYASYTLSRVMGLAWEWEADFRGKASRRGYCLLKSSARWAARSWLRQRREADEAPKPVVTIGSTRARGMLGDVTAATNFVLLAANTGPQTLDEAGGALLWTHVVRGPEGDF